MNSARPSAAPPPASGRRRPYADLPVAVRRAVEAYLGSPVVEAASQPGGFSPGVAARLRLRDGRRAFLKAVRARWNPDTPTLHRTEATIAASLPGSVPAPRFLWSYDDGECVALLFEDVEGRTPTIPWREDELRRVLLMVTELAASLTPAPITAAPAGQTFERLFTGWRRFRENPTAAAAAAGVDAWARSHLDRLADLEARWPEGTGGETLLHMDLRADNILLTATGALVVDWPWASIGAAWLDLLLMLPSISMQGGPPPWELFDAHPVARGAPPDAVTAAVAGLAGFFLFAATLPPPPGLPTVRRFQRAQGRHALRWLAQRTGWPAPDPGPKSRILNGNTTGGGRRMRAYVLINASAGKAIDVAKRLQGVQGITNADAITGEYDVIAQIDAPDVAGIGNVIVEKIQKVDGVFKTVTCLAVR